MTPEDRRAVLDRIAVRIEDGMMVEEATRAEGITGTTLRNWVREDTPEGRALFAVYARAREAAADQLAERAVRIATGDEAVKEGTDRRLAYDALRWLAGKRRPKEYGDRQQVDTTTTVTVITPAERDARLARIVARATLLPANDIDHATEVDQDPTPPTPRLVPGGEGGV